MSHLYFLGRHANFLSECVHQGNTSDEWGIPGRYASVLNVTSTLMLIFSKYSLREIVNVEENHDVLKGDRYLIDVVSTAGL